MLLPIIDVQSAEELEQLKWISYAAMHDLTLADIQHICGLYDRYWSCDPDNPGKYHAEWSSGKHSPDFFDFATVLREKSNFLLCLTAWKVIQEAKALGCGNFTAVVGSATGTTALAKKVAELSGTRFIELVKDPDDPLKKNQLWKEGQEPLTQDDVVLHIEELTSTVSTPPRVRQCVNDFHAELGIYIKWVRWVIAVVDRRSPEEQATCRYPVVDDWQLHGVFQFPSRLQKPEECTMCKEHGSTAVRPREGDNWALLKGEDA